ncbi:MULTISPECIES: hypothetical protein [Rheinheimera]|uniref:hypothetical protein n=1 Tax=Rheinheimera TaxID=67575 RepID=UPI001CFFF9A4|nr:hypothetical protein [Rheinheimera aquimaris]MCB5213714.1 hypothetical protein [Rheinheimera aquimaris]MCD1598103.1 hypothetical protein [Rheinheimera aquimaris]|tara:strand:+ start:200 stop:598 length:399 start_codon:yes stop_codon:yes gene_type:complete
MQQFIFSTLYSVGILVVVVFAMAVSTKLSSLTLATPLWYLIGAFLLVMFSYWQYSSWGLRRFQRFNIVRLHQWAQRLSGLAAIVFGCLALLTAILMQRAGTYTDEQTFAAIYPFLLFMAMCSAIFSVGRLRH